MHNMQEYQGAINACGNYTHVQIAPLHLQNAHEFRLYYNES